MVDKIYRITLKCVSEGCMNNCRLKYFTSLSKSLDVTILNSDWPHENPICPFTRTKCRWVVDDYDGHWDLIYTGYKS